MNVNYKKCRDTCEHCYICKYVSQIQQIEEKAETLNTYEVSNILVRVSFDCDHYLEIDK